MDILSPVPATATAPSDEAAGASAEDGSCNRRRGRLRQTLSEATLLHLQILAALLQRPLRISNVRLHKFLLRLLRAIVFWGS